MEKTAVIYSRVSSPGKRQSTERQLVDLEKYAAYNSYQVLKCFSENISGVKKNENRKILQECIDFCVSNKVDTLLLTEISRLGRSTLEILKILDELHANKISVYIQNLNIETLRPDKTINPLSSLVTTLLGELAGLERQGIIERLNSGRNLYIEKGGKLGRNVGSRKTLDQKKEEYKEVITLLKKGYSIRNVAKLTKRAPATIQSIKSEFGL